MKVRIGLETFPQTRKVLSPTKSSRRLEIDRSLRFIRLSPSYAFCKWYGLVSLILRYYLLTHLLSNTSKIEYYNMQMRIKSCTPLNEYQIPTERILESTRDITCIHGTPAAVMIAFDVDLMPMSRMADDGGPTKMTPLSAQASANSVFSDKNP